MSWIRRTLAALGIVAAGVVVRCGDTDDDDEDDKRRSRQAASAYAQEATIDAGLKKESFGWSQRRLY